MVAPSALRTANEAADPAGSGIERGGRVIAPVAARDAIAARQDEAGGALLKIVVVPRFL